MNLRYSCFCVAMCVTSVNHALKVDSLLLDQLNYKIELQTTVGDGRHNSLWLNANKYGLSSLESYNGYLRAAAERPLSLDDHRRWGFGYCLDVAAATHFTSKLIVQQAYVEGRWLKGTFSIGSKQQPMEMKDAELSSGSQTLGKNARPIPEARLALRDYWTVPYTKGWLSLKGHLS